MNATLAPEIAHVVAMDRVGFSVLPLEQKARLSAELLEAVRSSPAFQEAVSTGSAVPLDSGDGVAVAFFGNHLRAIQLAQEVHDRVNRDADVRLRIGIHSGPVQRRTDIAGKENVDGQGIDLAFRVMGFADGECVLLSDTYASFLQALEGWSERLKEMGERSAKHGAKLRLWRVIGPRCGPRKTGIKVVLLYKRHNQPDDQLLQSLQSALIDAGHEVFVDCHLTIGVEWAKAIEHEIRTCDVVVALLSEAACASEMVLYELQLASSELDRRGRPFILPIRIGTDDPVAGDMGAIVNRYQYTVWDCPDDSEPVCKAVLGFLTGPHAQRLEPVAPLEQPGGAVPLSSPYYVNRPTDEEFLTAIRRRDSIVLVKGARQMGKTSLLARGVQASRDLGSRVVLTDLQTLSGSQLETDEKLYLSIAHAFAFQLGLQISVKDSWNEWLGANSNLESFLQSKILSVVEGHILWALDEVDRLFSYPYACDFFALMRSWHNRRALEPDGPWSRLTIAIGYATEAHLFIADLNQSPFNVGTRLSLEDFTKDQVRELNVRYGSPLKTPGEIDGFYTLLDGQPFLTRRAMDEMVRHGLTFAQIEESADHEEGMFGDHLRRFLVALAGDERLARAMKGVLSGTQPDNESFFRLRSGGLVVGDSPSSTRVRCSIYAKFLSRHLYPGFV